MKYHLTRHAREDKLASMGISADQFFGWLARADDPNDIGVQWMRLKKQNKRFKDRGRLLRITTEDGYDRYVVILADDGAVITVFNPETREEGRLTTIEERLKTLNRYLEKSDLPTLTLAELSDIEQALESLDDHEARRMFGVGGKKCRIPVLKDGVGIFLHYYVGHNISIRNPTSGTINSFVPGEHVAFVEICDGQVAVTEVFRQTKAELSSNRVSRKEKEQARKERQQLRQALAAKSREIGVPISVKQINRLNEALQREQLDGYVPVQFSVFSAGEQVTKTLLLSVDEKYRVYDLEIADPAWTPVDLGKI